MGSTSRNDTIPEENAVFPEDREVLNNCIVGDIGLEGPTKSSGKSVADNEVSAPVSATDPGLALIAAAWPKLSPETRRAILERVERDIDEARAGTRS